MLRLFITPPAALRKSSGDKPPAGYYVATGSKHGGWTDGKGNYWYPGHPGQVKAVPPGKGAGEAQNVAGAGPAGSVFSVRHSHTTSTDHPSPASWARTSASRSMLRASFAVHHSVLLLGMRWRGQPSCPCQKQPWTKTTSRREAKTRSGCPGNSLEWRRKRRPAPHNARRTAISGRVFLLRTLDMTSERVMGARGVVTAWSRRRRGNPLAHGRGLRARGGTWPASRPQEP